MSVAGAVLAAGASRRMGTDKALLTCGGACFLDTLAQALLEGGCRPVLAVAGRAASRLQLGCRLEDVELVVNPDPSRGQISSLRCALEAVGQAQGLVVVLVDQGRVEAHTVRLVREALDAAPVAVARYHHRPGHPTGFGREVFGALRSHRADGGAREVVSEMEEAGRVRWVDVDDPGVVRNLNTPDDYAAFRRTARLNRSP